jgi:succinyl-CoA synthetase alpha subunit
LLVKTIVKTGEYHDSVRLMLVARELLSMNGVRDAAVVMATPANKSILAGAGMLSEQVEAATPNDLVIVVSGESASLLDEALRQANILLEQKAAPVEGGITRPKTIRGAMASHPSINVAVISVAGRYAADEAWEALHRGLHVLLFSDNVSLEDEIALKRYARERGLLLMGPGAGTTILNNVALGFANALPPGPVGIVSAAGTGLQEVSCALARHGVGISQGLGIGGRDLSVEVGGVMMLESMKALQSDDNTQVIVLISKPPAGRVVSAVLDQVTASDKPSVVCFLGQDGEAITGKPNVLPARTLQEAVWLAARLAGADLPEVSEMIAAENARLESLASQLQASLQPDQKYLRALFSGGTLCYEAQVVWKEILDTPVFSNAPLTGAPRLPDSMRSQEHTAIDLGEEEFTIGRPHPMIENDLRVRRLLQEAQDPQVGVIMLDVVLGYGAHPDPASDLGAAIGEAQRLARGTGRELVVVASVTGTENDPQSLSRTAAVLERSGAVLCESNAAAARLSGLLVRI